MTVSLGLLSTGTSSSIMDGEILAAMVLDTISLTILVLPGIATLNLFSGILLTSVLSPRLMTSEASTDCGAGGGLVIVMEREVELTCSVHLSYAVLIRIW